MNQDLIISGYDLYNHALDNLDDEEISKLMGCPGHIDSGECPVSPGYWIVRWPEWSDGSDFNQGESYIGPFNALGDAIKETGGDHELYRDYTDSQAA